MRQPFGQGNRCCTFRGVLPVRAEGFRRALERIGVTDVFFELFDGTHSSIEYRYPLALRYLAERLQPR